MSKLSIIWTVLLTAMLAVGCEQDSVLEDAAEAGDEAMDEMHDSVEEAGDEIEDAADEIDNTRS